MTTERKRLTFKQEVYCEDGITSNNNRIIIRGSLRANISETESWNV